ncbi:MAG: hypothetical protein R3B54_14165 [Bdellovibrionota bacterium]
MKRVLGSLSFVAFTLVSQVFAMAPPPVSEGTATASVPEIPTNLIPWIIGGSAAVLVWARRFFK